MKKSILTIAATLLLGSFITSCKKDYECHCETSTGKADHFEIKAKAKDADAECEKLKGSTYVKCEIE